jgi:hypothetical protein
MSRYSPPSKIAAAEAPTELPPFVDLIQSQFRSPLLRIDLPAALCFLVINIMNSTILEFLWKHHLIYGADADLLENFDKTIRFFLNPAKSLIFFLCTAVLILPLGVFMARQISRHLNWQQVRKTLLSLFFTFILIATIVPTGYGRSYARISTDPFNQDLSHLYRRLLIPGLANIYHLDGFLYIFLFWALVSLTALTARIYFIRKNINFTVLQEVSLLTCGIFASSFEFPGFPEVAVLLLAIIALIAYEEDGMFTATQLLAFSLALMAHEACAIIVFAPMILALFGRKSWLPSATVVAIYVITLIANFSFNILVPLDYQARVSDIPASTFFLRSPGCVLLGAAFSFKLLWLFLPVAIYLLFKREKRTACFVLLSFAFALASTYIAVDYGRMVGFAAVAMMVCFLTAQQNLPPRIFNAVVALNILVPSFYAGSNSGLVTFRGLYYLAYKLVFSLPTPGIKS